MGAINVADILTMQDLANGHLDVKALGEAANGDENTIVTTRTGNTYPSAERAIKTLFENGGLPATPFATKALMTASSLVDGKYAQVTDDTVNNGLYLKTAGAWVKSNYDPLAQAKSYTDLTLSKSSGTFDTLALLTASTLADNTYALVANDTDLSKNGHYKKLAGVWTKVKYQPVEQVINSLSTPNYFFGDLYKPTGILKKYYLKSTGLLGTVSAKNYDVYRFKVTQGSSYFIKVTNPTTYPFAMFYVADYDDLSTTIDNRTKVTLEPTDTTNVYKFIVPSEGDIDAIFMNLTMLDDRYTLDLSSTLSIQKDRYDPLLVGVEGKGVDEIGGVKLVDSYARRKVDNISADLGASLAKTTRLTGKKIYTFGDSITAGTNTGGNYQDIMRTITGATITNFGSSGAGHRRLVAIMTDQPSRTSAGEVFATPDYSDVDVVTIMIGTNDSAHIVGSNPSSSAWGGLDSIPVGTPQTASDTNAYFQSFADTYTGNVAMCIEFVRWKNPNIEINLITPPYRYGSGATPDVENYGTGQIAKITPILKKLSDFYSCNLIHGTFESGIGYKDMPHGGGLYTYDGIHFNALGNDIFGKFIAQKLITRG